LKNRENRLALGAELCPQTPKPPADGGYAPRSYISPISLRIPRCVLIKPVLSRERDIKKKIVI